MDLERSEGTTMVEMVFILPVLLLVLFGIIEFAVAFGRWQVISNAAREGARAAVVYRDPDTCSAAAVKAAVDAAVLNYASALGITLAAADVTVSGACDRTNPATVSVSFTHDFVVLPNFSPGGLIDPSVDLVSQSTMRNE